MDKKSFFIASISFVLGILISYFFLSRALTEKESQIQTLQDEITAMKSELDTLRTENKITILLKDLEEDTAFTLGYKGYYPFSASLTMNSLIEIGPVGFPFLEQALEKSTDPEYQRALLFVIAHIDDPHAEETLLQSLEDENLRGLSLYLLGNYFYRSPTASVDTAIRDKEKVLESIKRYVTDRSDYTFVMEDNQETVQIRDLALAAYVRIGDVINLDEGICRWVGLSFPEFTEEQREELFAFIEEGPQEKPFSWEACPLFYIHVPFTVGNGTFVFEYNDTASPRGLQIEMNFTPTVTNSCSKIYFIQVGRQTRSTGENVYPDAIVANRSTANNWSLDRLGGRHSPYYGTDDNTTNNMSNARAGSRNATDTKTSWMYDFPRISPGDTLEFETCAVCAEGSPNPQGPDRCACYGCIKWSFTVNLNGTVTAGPVTHSNTPSQDWKDAMNAWNNQQRGNMQASHCLP